MSGENYVASWGDAHRYSPAPRHRRRLIAGWIRRLRFADCLDAGCAQPYLLEKLYRRRIAAYGCDVSDEVIRQNRIRFPYARFEQFDLVRQVWPGGRRFDLVVCSEALEHVEDWEAALANLTKMCRRHLLITVPGGKIRPIDRHIGHLRHFSGDELSTALRAHGMDVIRFRRWGWPVHSLYKHAINGVMPRSVYRSFGEKRYGFAKKLFSQIINIAFYVNDVFPWGTQLLILTQRRDPGRFDGSLQEKRRCGENAAGEMDCQRGSQ